MDKPDIWATGEVNPDYPEWAEKRIAELEQRVEVLEEALDTELVLWGTGTLDMMESPKHAIAAIAKWHYDLGVSRILEGDK